MAAGYSASPLYKKLGFKEAFTVKLMNAPANYLQLLGDVPFAVVIDNTAASNIDLLHLFTNSASELETLLPQLMLEIKRNGIIWVSWYKKSAGIATEISENFIRDTALAAGLVDVKVCAIDEEWSGLKLVYRLKDR